MKTAACRTRNRSRSSSTWESRQDATKSVGLLRGFGLRSMSAPHIEVEGLTVAYQKPKAAGTLIAVSNANLDIRRGTFVTIVGPSGCGKSSLLLSIAGLIQPAGGCVRVNGRPVSGPGRDRAVVFQDFALMPWRTVLENVRFGLELHRWSGEDLTARAGRYVELVGLKG